MAFRERMMMSGHFEPRWRARVGRLCVLLALGLLAGCQYDPHAHRYTTTEPSIAKIAGEYALSEIYMESYAPGIREKVEQLPSPPTIRLGTDGTFLATDFPYFSETRQGFEYRFEEFRSLETTWRLSAVGAISDGSGTIKTHHGLELADLPAHLGSPGFIGMNRVEGLIFGFGDPDSGDAIIFLKKPAAE